MWPIPGLSFRWTPFSMLNVIGVNGGISLHVVDGHLKCMSPSDQFPDRKFKVLLIEYQIKHLLYNNFTLNDILEAGVTRPK